VCNPKSRKRKQRKASNVKEPLHKSRTTGVAPVGVS
jgi:hypothetical protein